jgi:LPS sulfotransferase NodH
MAFTLILCTTPRVGSTLLCSLLASSGVCGLPESWYRAEDRAHYARKWGLAAKHGAGEYLASVRKAGMTANGVGALRIQAPTLAPLLAELQGMFPAVQGDSALFERAFGPCRYLYIHRQDALAQAISRLKAEQTQVWHMDGSAAKAVQEPQYDADRIRAFMAEAAAGNAQWLDWFQSNGITPETLIYEAFSADPAETVRQLLHKMDLLDQALPILAPNQRMANAESAAWAKRFRQETGWEG